MKHRIRTAVIGLVALVTAAALGVVPTSSPARVEAASPVCYLQFLYGSNGFANGGKALCVNTVRWRVVVNCGVNRVTTHYVTTVRGPWRYFDDDTWSGKFCPSQYPYARWVSREYV